MVWKYDMLKVRGRDYWRDEVRFAYCCVTLPEVFVTVRPVHLGLDRRLEETGCWEIASCS